MIPSQANEFEVEGEDDLAEFKSFESNCLVFVNVPPSEAQDPGFASVLPHR